jgi:hypothetical protein
MPFLWPCCGLFPPRQRHFCCEATPATAATALNKRPETMTFLQIYERVLPLWGEAITFADGVMMESPKHYKTLSGAAGATRHFYSKSFSDQWKRAADALPPDDAYGDLMVWTLYQVFQEQASQLAEKNQYAFSPAAISKKIVEERYYKNLHDQGWEDQLAGYERVTE